MRLSIAVLACVAGVAQPALAQNAQTEESFPARLAGHALLPAMTMAAPPADAPRDLWISGKFTGKTRIETPMSVAGDTGEKYGRHGTGISLPFIGQPVQGIHRLDQFHGGHLLFQNDHRAVQRVDLDLFSALKATDLERSAGNQKSTIVYLFVEFHLLLLITLKL